VGEKEKADKTVNVRTRDNMVHGEHKLSAVIEVLQQERAQRSLESLFGHENGAKAPAAAAAQPN
jgi:threonyl-tRNA synthetase